MKNTTCYVFVIIFLEVLAYALFNYLGVDANIIATLITAIAIFGGYYIVHDLEVEKNQKDKKLELCLEMVKNLRLFLNEPYYMNKEEQKKFRDEFIDSYFKFSILVSNASYKKLESVVEQFIKFLAKEITREEFKKTQSEFINQLRQEFSNEEEIDFGAYAIEIPIDGGNLEIK